MNIAIVDDLTVDSNYLCTLLQDYFQTNNIDFNITTFSDGNDFIASFTPGKYNLVFLDIYMPNMTGMDLAKQFYEKDPNCHIIFVTSSSDFAVESYDVNAIYYIIKPISQEKLELALKRCESALLTNNKFIDFTFEKNPCRVFLKDILYIEKQYRKLILHTCTRNYTLTTTWNDFLEGNALDDRFLECFRGIIVNMDHISQALEVDFLLDNNEKVPLRQRSRTLIKKQYMDYMFNNLKQNNWKEESLWRNLTLYLAA